MNWKWLAGGAGILYLFFQSKSSVAAQSSSGGTSDGSDIPLDAKKRIVRVIGALESGLNYAAVNDKDPSKEVSYGLLQASLRSGNLDKLLQLYEQMSGQYAQQLTTYKQNGGWRHEQLAYDQSFRDILKQAGADPVMQKAQDTFFARDFLVPAYEYAKNTLGLRLPASYLVVADTFINSGPTNAKNHLKNLPSAGTETDRVLAYQNWRKGFFKSLYDGRITNANTEQSKKAYRIDQEYGMWRVGTLLPSIMQSNPQLNQPVTIKFPGSANIPAWSRGYTA